MENNTTPPPLLHVTTLPPVQHKFWTTFLLALTCGSVGAHRFAVGKTKSGLIQLLTMSGLGIWLFVDLITIILGKFKDSKGNVISSNREEKKGAVLVLVLLFAGIGIASQQGNFRVGSYARKDGYRVSSIRFNKDSTCYMELNTDFGYIEKFGKWTLGGVNKTIAVHWDGFKTKNIYGPQPDLDRDQTFRFGRDSIGGPFVQIGNAQYWRQK